MAVVQKEVKQSLTLILGDCRSKYKLHAWYYQGLKTVLTIVAIPLRKHKHALVKYDRECLGGILAISGGCSIPQEVED